MNLYMFLKKKYKIKELEMFCNDVSKLRLKGYLSIKSLKFIEEVNNEVSRGRLKPSPYYEHGFYSYTQIESECRRIIKENKKLAV